MSPTSNESKVKDTNHDSTSQQIKNIPELMIPSYETSPTEDPSECCDNTTTTMIKPIISPDSIGAHTKSTKASTEIGSLVEEEYSSSPPPPSPSNMINNGNDGDADEITDRVETSPTNPSAPLTSPSRKGNLNLSPPLNEEIQRSHTASSVSPKPADGAESLRDILPPAHISQRDRVVSVDRVGYMNNSNPAEYQDDDDDDDDDASSNGSSDGENSYFSEHLPSPPRRRESMGTSNPRLLPPGGGTHNKNVHMSSMFTRQYPASQHGSDLSLSSSSSEEDNLPSQNVNLKNTYPITRTKSAPVKNAAKLLPRKSSADELIDLFYHSESKTDNGRDRLNVIDITSEDQLAIPQPQNVQRFPSTSSLVSSSSEDVERISSAKPTKHRRQSSYRSVGSITSAGSAFLPEKPRKMSNGEYANVSNKLPELVSFSGGSDASRHSKSSSKNSSSDHRIPTNKSYHDPPKIQQVATLNDEQMNAWRSGGGISRSDSYFSSSNGNASGHEISPDRPSRNFQESASLSNGSRHSSQVSRSGSGIFIYSEDETDESIRYKESGGHKKRDGSRFSVSSNNQGHSPNTRSRSFGRDLTNADEIEPTPRNAQINPIPDRRAQKLYENQSGSMSSSNNQGTFRTSNEMYNNDSENYSMMSRTMGYKVYWKRWVMLMYVSLLNLLSDWTCFSVAPIALLTKETFQIVNPEHLVTIFLFANTLSTATEPILLARLGLRKTIVFGSFLLMCGNVIKSAGIPGFIGSGIEDETDAWRLFVGFFLVGLSQPLYQCTPSILSSSWFPEKERTLATGVALNSNQLGIGFSFIFGTLLVVTSDDISNYFGFLSILSTLVFIGCYFHFQDAPPSPPSETARVMKGNIIFPYFNNMQQTIPHYFRRPQAPIIPGPIDPYDDIPKSYRRSMPSSGSGGSSESRSNRNSSRTENQNSAVGSRSSRRSKRSDRRRRESPTNAFKSTPMNRPRKGSSESIRVRRQRSGGSRSMKSDANSRSSRRRDNAHSLAPSPALGIESTSSAAATINNLERQAEGYGTIAPSSMMSGQVRHHRNRDNEAIYYDSTPQRNGEHRYQQTYQYTPHSSVHPMSANHPYMPNYYAHQHNFPDLADGIPDTPFANLRHTNMNHPSSGNMIHGQQYMHAMPYDYRDTPIQYFPPNIDPRFYYQQVPLPHGLYNNMHHDHHYRPLQAPNGSYIYGDSNDWLPPKEGDNEGIEPVLMHAGSSLSIDIRDDQIIRSIKACFSQPGFIQTVVAFAVSGIVLNTISTYMDSLLSPSGAGRGAVGLIGGLFQVLVMVSSMIIGRITDKRRAYYCIVIVLLLLGAFTLAECAINLEAERGNSLKWTLLILAVFVGPLQPVATELGVEVVYPLSENTVLVVQQLVSNLTSAIFIPFFQEAKNYAKEGEDFERPEYTFSFIVLMATHVLATIFFATYNGSYKRYEHEQRRKSKTGDDSAMKNNDEAHIVDVEKQSLL